MTEISRFWNGVATGDAVEAPYDAPTEFAEVLSSLGGGALNPNLGGVFRAELNMLAVSGTVSPVSIATGRAVVDGTWYENDAATTIAIPTPSVSTRIDRIVLRKSWAAQTVRLTRIAGTEGAAAPAMTQTPGVTWDFPLAQASITTGGVITITDDRRFRGEHIVIIKADDEIVNASAVLQDDNDFRFPIGANEHWIVDQWLDTNNITDASNFQLTWTLPAGAAMLCTAYGNQYSTTSSQTGQRGTTPGTGITLPVGVNGIEWIMVRTTIRNGATSGVAQFQWAQGSSTAVDTTIREDSSLVAHRVA